MNQKSKKAWGGRFAQKENVLMEQFNASISFDKKLYREDIQGSLAHAHQLCNMGVITKKDFSKIEKGLLQIREEIESQKFHWGLELEDVHMAIESRLTALIGPLGGKLHTARSRNDQVATDLRLFSKNKIQNLLTELTTLQKVFLNLAKEKGFVILPGYTHLQRAQPIYLAHHLLAYVEMFSRDKERLLSTLSRLDVSPLGSGALAGSTFPLKREETAKKMGFANITHNSLDAVSDRDFVAELLFNLSLIMAHLSRLAEELILWSTQEFSFITLPQEFCTGSSMMPQKVNPDAPELIRGKTGRVYGNLIGLLTTLKGLPLAYNKDLQEDKEPLFDSLETVFLCVQVLSAMLPGIQIHDKKMLQATEEGFLLATDVADYLVTKGLEFRKAHEVVGALVRHCLDKKTVLEKLSVGELQKFSPLFESDIKKWLDVNVSVNRRSSVGGTAKNRVQSEIKRHEKSLGA